VHETARSASAISKRLAEVLGEPLDGELSQLSSGASRETFAFATRLHGPLVAQLETHAARGAPPSQAALLNAAAKAGAPVPAIVASGSGDDVLGEGWIVAKALPGTTDPGAILAGRGVPPAAALIESIAAALAAVHRIPANPMLAPAVEDPVALLRAQYDQLGEPHATFELAFGALGARPTPARRTLVHGDFRIGNLMVGQGGVTGVLDWELAHVGDPVEDLGWLCVPAWRFARPDLPAAGLGSREQLRAAYGRHAGVTVDPEELAWWELAGTLRWGVICGMQAHQHLSGAIASIEHAVIGRRACEVEWDLLEMLDLDRTAAPEAQVIAPAPTAASLHDRPTMPELIEAARGALGEEVLPGLEDRAAFQLRVTMRALGMIARELQYAERHAAVQAAALGGLGVADEAALVTAIRAGAMAGREQEVFSALRMIVRAKLEVANPRYLSSRVMPSAQEEP